MLLVIQPTQLVDVHPALLIVRLAIPSVAPLAHQATFSMLLLPVSKYVPSLVYSAPGVLLLPAPNVLTVTGSQEVNAKPTIHAILTRTAATAHSIHRYPYKAPSPFSPKIASLAEVCAAGAAKTQLVFALHVSLGSISSMGFVLFALTNAWTV